MCSNNTTLFDDRANDEADRHAQMMQKQRKGWDGKKTAVEIISVEHFKKMVGQVNEQ